MVARAHEQVQLALGYTSLSQFDHFKALSSRENSTIFRARCVASGRIVAIKRYAKEGLSAKEAIHVAREIHIHETLLSTEPGVVQCFGSFEDAEYICIVMELCAGDIFDAVLSKHKRGVAEAYAVNRVIRPLLVTLDSIYSRHGVIHRDIKPENVLLTHSGELRLADFGTAISQLTEVPFLALGTLDFMAPEVMRNMLPSGAVESPCTTPEMLFGMGVLPYNHKVDVWSLGAMAYELIVGEPPFWHENNEETKRMIMEGTYLYIPSSLRGTPFSSFVTAALQRNPAARPSAAELLHHEWLAQHSNAGYAGKIQEKELQRLSVDGKEIILRNGSKKDWKLEASPTAIRIDVDATGGAYSAATGAPPPAAERAATETIEGLLAAIGEIHLSDGGAAPASQHSSAATLDEFEDTEGVSAFQTAALTHFQDAESESPSAGQLRRAQSAPAPRQAGNRFLRKFSLKRNDSGVVQ